MIGAFASVAMIAGSFVVWTVGLFVVVKLVKGVGLLIRALTRGTAFGIRHIFSFVKGMLVDTVNFTGSLVSGVVIGALAITNLAFGRWQSFKHYGRAVENELVGAAASLYRVGLGHPLRLAFLGRIASVFERRVPDLIERAPRERGQAQPGVFAGYEVLGTLPTGGSGAQLFLARPTPSHAAELGHSHANVPDRVVIKSFILGLGSTLPQMIREGRALEAARRLGLLVEHKLAETSFYYVMPFVDGDELGTLTDRLHAAAPSEGLGEGSLRLVLSWTADLLRTLERFHTGGLWHKDIKPANVLVADGRAHLVDFGLVTSLASGLTLTTHGTEFYRDPEMVRLAMRGVKVHEVDGVKFDLYSLGALMYSMVEGSFPAHGSLSQISKRCPESLRWIIRRAMADVDSRYGSAAEMRTDLAALQASADPFTLRPADLPSLGGERAAPEPAPQDVAWNEPKPAAFAAAEATVSPKELTPCRRKTFRKLVVAGVAVAVVATALKDRHEEASSFGNLHSQQRTRAEVANNASDDLDDLDFELPASLEHVLAANLVEPAFLVLSDSIAWARHRDEIEAVAERLQDDGFRVLDRDATPREGDLDLIAGAKVAIQFRDAADPEALKDLQYFLDQSSALDGIVWLTSTPHDQLRSTVFFRDAWTDAPVVSAEFEDEEGSREYAIY